MSKVSKDRMVLHLPFDEEVGSQIAHNYAPNRTQGNDAILSGDCSFTDDAIFGNAIHLGASGECHINENIINFGGEFTISAFIKPIGGEISFSMAFPDQNTQQYYNARVSQSKWTFVAIQHILLGGAYYTRFILDGQVIYNEPSIGEVGGCNISLVDGDECIVDELRVWNRAISMSEIAALQLENDDVEYYVDGVNFKSYGVEVSRSEGLVDALARKEPLRVEWDSYHGEVVDLSRPRWQRREIILECFIVASNNTAFVRSLNRFMEAFQKAGTQRLTCEYAGSVKPLEYDVYRDDAIEVDKTWNSGTMVGTFSVTLIEPQPIKMVLKHICQSGNSEAWFQCDSDRMLNVTWGDMDDSCQVAIGTPNIQQNSFTSRTKSCGLHGAPVKVKHTFSSAGEYDIVIHGNIEDITNLSTNCIVVWSKL